MAMNSFPAPDWKGADAADSKRRTLLVVEVEPLVRMLTTFLLRESWLLSALRPRCNGQCSTDPRSSLSDG